MKTTEEATRAALILMIEAENYNRKIYKAIGAEMRQARVSAGLSIREVAREMAFSHVFLLKLEQGEASWNPHKVRLMRRVIERLSAAK